MPPCTSNDCSGDAPHAGYLSNFWWHQEDSSSIYSYPFNLSQCSPSVCGCRPPLPALKLELEPFSGTCSNLSSNVSLWYPFSSFLVKVSIILEPETSLQQLSVVTKIIESHYLLLILFLNINKGCLPRDRRWRNKIDGM